MTTSIVIWLYFQSHTSTPCFRKRSYRYSVTFDGQTRRCELHGSNEVCIHLLHIDFGGFVGHVTDHYSCKYSLCTFSRTPLHLASANGFTHTVLVLIERHAEVNCKDQFKYIIYNIVNIK